MTNSRAARYFMEAFGEYDPLKPEIKPLRRQTPRKDELGDYLMPETMDFYIKAVVDLWTEQATSAPNGMHPGAEKSPRKIARPFMEAYKRKIGRQHMTGSRTSSCNNRVVRGSTVLLNFFHPTIYSKAPSRRPRSSRVLGSRKDTTNRGSSAC